MAIETAVAEAVDLGVPEESDWGRMNPAERNADIEKASREIAARESEIDDDDQSVVTPETPGKGEETPAPADAVPKADGQGDEEDDRGWLDADTKDLAAAMGLTDEDLSEFGSRAELDRALRIIDRKAFEAGKASQQPPPAAAKPTEQQSASQQRTTDALAELASFKLDDELGADDAPKISKAINAITAELQEMRSWRDGQRQQEGQQAFQDLRTKAIDSLRSLGHAELFGKPGEQPTPEQAENIEKAIDAHFTHARGLLASGRDAAPTPAFLKAAVNLAFGDQLSQQAKQQLTEKLKRQSAKRTGGGASKALQVPPPEGESTRQMARRIAADPEVQEAWNLAVSGNAS